MTTPQQEQNRLGIVLAIECLENNDFVSIFPNRPQGTYPDTHIIAKRDSATYFIGVSSREEIGADGQQNPSFNLVRPPARVAEARKLARRKKAVPAFVTIALNRPEGMYSAFFGSLELIDFRASVPMLPADRRCYESLADRVPDPRVAELR